MSVIVIILAYILIFYIVRKLSKKGWFLSKATSTVIVDFLGQYFMQLFVRQFGLYYSIPSFLFSRITLYFTVISHYRTLDNLLRNCQCFCNALILLDNQKRSLKKYETFRLEKKLNQSKYHTWIKSFLTPRHGCETYCIVFSIMIKENDWKLKVWEIFQAIGTIL